MSSKNIFIGREEELGELKAFLKKKTASLIVIKGRRRIGNYVKLHIMAKRV